MEKIIEHYLERNPISTLRSPAYIYFPSQAQRNLSEFRKFVENGIDVFFALKANHYIPFLKEIVTNNYGFDIASREELAVLESLGANPSNITFSAPSKRHEDIEIASKFGVKYFAFDSEEEIKKIVNITSNAILFARVAVENKNAAFNLTSKFGMYEDYFYYILQQAKKNEWKIQGLTFHVGSQNTAISSWQHALRRVTKLIEMAEDMGTKISYLNIGGGIPAQYTNKIKPVSFYIDSIVTLCNKMKKKFQGVKIMVEPGRSLCANTMALATKIIDIKPYKNPPLLVVDTGVFNGIIEPIEHFEYPIYTKHIKSSNKKRFSVAGFSCEGYDIISQDVLLPRSINIGDSLIFMYAGAYTFVYKNFHMVPYPNFHNAEATIMQKSSLPKLNTIDVLKQERKDSKRTPIQIG